MRELFLGKLKEPFDTSKMVAPFLASFLGREDELDEISENGLFDSGMDLDDLEKFDVDIYHESMWMVDVLAKKYNQQIYAAHSFQFWKTLYFPWVYSCLSWLYRKQLMSDYVIRQFGDEILYVSILDLHINPRIETESDYFFKVDSDADVNEWILGKFIKNNLPKKWQVQHCQKNVSFSVTNADNRTPVKLVLYRLFKKWTQRTFSVYGFNVFHEVYFQLLFGLKPTIEVGALSKPELKNRVQWKIDLEQLIDELIPQELKQLPIGTLKLRSFKKGKMINFSNTLYHNMEAKVEAAFAYEHGEVIIASQHGGHRYGSAYSNMYGKGVEFDLHYFLSWGWDKVNDESLDNVIRLPSPMLSKYLNTYQQKNNKIILVGTALKAFENIFKVSPSESHLLGYMRMKRNYMQVLKKIGAMDSLWYRPYSSSRGFDDPGYFEQSVGDLNILEGKLHEAIQKCRLLVLDHPGTTWNIAMAMNIPTLLFWNKEAQSFNRKADEFLKEFQELGLYFDNPEKAAKKTEELTREGFDTWKWWNSTEIQSLRQRWMQEYGLADKNWLKIWTKTLWKIGQPLKDIARN